MTTTAAVGRAAAPVENTAPTRTSRVPHWVRRAAPPVLVAVLGLVAWYAVGIFVLTDRTRFLLPYPHTIIATLADPDVASAVFSALGQTTLVALTGLAIATVIGVAWAVAMSQAKWVERSLFPYAVVLQCIPILALVPLIGFWFGFDFPARVIVCVMIALFPIVSNTLFGLQSVDRAQRELFRLQKAGRWVVLLRLEMPAALPAMFAGLRISAGLSVVGAIVGDFFFRRGNPGLGSLISNYQSRVQGPELFVAIAVAALFGIAIFLLFGWFARSAVGRWYTPSRS